MGSHELFGQVRQSDVTNLISLVDPSTRIVMPGGAYGVKGDGTTDDAAAIRAALAATPDGGTCLITPGRYRTLSPIVVPPNRTLQCSHAPSLTYNTGSPVAPCMLLPGSTFSGSAVVRVVDKTTGGYAADSVNTRLRNIAIDGVSSPAGLKGIELYGYVRETVIESCSISRMTGNAFEANGYGTFTGDATPPLSFRLTDCFVSNNGGAGYAVTNCPDITLTNCLALGSGWHNFYIAGAPNGLLLGCRAEWSNNNGFYVTSGNWGSGQGSGGMQLTGCTTDRNNQNGVLVDATGSGSITINGLVTRRDGRNNNTGGGGYAGLAALNATMPVIADGVVVYPGVGDDGSGTMSPERGVSATSSGVFVIASGYLHAVTTPVNDGGGNAAFVVPATVGQATGPTTAPVRTAPRSSTLMSEVTGLNAALNSLNASALTSGTVDPARLPLAGTSGQAAGPLDANGDLPIAQVPAAASGVSSSALVPLANDSRLSDARTPVAHSATLITSGVLAAARLPPVPSVPVSTAYTASWTPNAATGNVQRMAATGAVTLNPPTSPTDGQKMMVEIYGSGASSTVTIASGILRAGTIAASVTIATGKVGFFGLEYTAISGTAAWHLIAQTVQQ